MPMLTLKEYNDQVIKPQVEKFLAERNQTAEKFLEECDQSLTMHRRIMHWARTGEWGDA